VSVPAIDVGRDPLGRALRGFGPAGVISVLVILLAGNISVNRLPVVPIGATLALLWAWRSRTPWRDLGLARPKSWAGTLIIGLLLGVGLKLVMKALVMPIFGAPALNPAYQFLAGNRDVLPLAIWAMVVAGVSEEIVFRGFVLERARALFGRGLKATIGFVIVTSLWFGLIHYGSQQWPGVQQAVVFGLIFATILVRTGNVWMLMVAHVAFDLTALAIIYLGLEAAVAQLFFA
jgi:uncharacterized protein